MAEAVELSRSGLGGSGLGSGAELVGKTCRHAPRSSCGRAPHSGGASDLEVPLVQGSCALDELLLDTAPGVRRFRDVDPPSTEVLAMAGYGMAQAPWRTRPKAALGTRPARGPQIGSLKDSAPTKFRPSSEADIADCEHRAVAARENNNTFPSPERPFRRKTPDDRCSGLLAAPGGGPIDLLQLP